MSLFIIKCFEAYKKEALLSMTEILVVCYISFFLALNSGSFLLNSSLLLREKFSKRVY
jgi:hypothetical protein